MNDRETWRIRDPVHGLIVFGDGNDKAQNETDQIAWCLLNTSEFLKGVQVAEEYLEARFRLYKAVYMHKTTRAAEKMFDALLRTVTEDLRDDELARRASQFCDILRLKGRCLVRTSISTMPRFGPPWRLLLLHRILRFLSWQAACANAVFTSA